MGGSIRLQSDHCDLGVNHGVASTSFENDTKRASKIE